MKFRLPISLKEVASGAMLLAVVVVLIALLNFARKPVPYQYDMETLQTTNTTVCPGESFEYKIDLKVYQTPVTIWRTEMWFSNSPNPKAKWADKASDIEYFNWDKSIKGLIHVVNKVSFPKKNIYGENMPAGSYRYIVNLNTTGLSTPTSLTIPVTVPASCFK